MAEIGRLAETDIDTIVAVGGDDEHGKPAFWSTMLAEQSEGERVVVVARDSSSVVGYAHLKWNSKYPRFRDAHIPEISDLRVAPRVRRQGIATSIIARCEQMAIDAGRRTIGIGFGLYADYGPAQRLYSRLGYQPDGFGATYEAEPVVPGATVRVDDELVLWLVRRLAKSAAG